MECQSIIELLSPYLDGELNSSKAKFICKHLEHCPRCRNELLVLQEISLMLQGLPEITPPPDFHAGLQAKLDKLTTAASAEMVKQKVSPLQKFVYGTWSKFAAFAAVLILTLGITVLWDSEGWGIKIKPVQEKYDVLSEMPQSSQAVSKETGTEKQNNNEPDSLNIIVGSDSTKSGAKNDQTVNQKESKQTNYTPAKDKKTKIIASELPQETVAMKIQSETEKAVNEDIPEVIPLEVAWAKEPAMYDRVDPFTVGLDPKITADKTEDTGQEDQLLEQGQYSGKLITMQLDVEDIENAIAKILILSQKNNAAAEVRQNKVLIVVLSANYDPLAEQIQSLGQVTVKEFNDQAFTDQELNGERNSLGQQLYTISLELK